MPTAGKPLKGRAQVKDSKRRIRDPLSMEADQLRELELRRKRETLLKTRLQALQEEEQKMAEWSNREVQMRWIDMLRIEKLGELRGDIEVLSQLHEKTVDRKNAVIDMLFADLDESDEQYRLALRTHLQNVDTLLELHAQRTATMETEFERDLAELQEEFAKEKTHVQDIHQSQCQELITIMQRVAKEAADLEAELVAEFSQQKDETRDKTSEEYNVCKQGLELEILDLQNTINKEHDRYLQSADEKMRQYNDLTRKDSDTAERIAVQMRRIQRLQENIANWKASLGNNIHECEERNRALKEEKDSTAKHLELLKGKMQRWRTIQEENLNQLVEMAAKTQKILKAKAEKAERALRLAELCRVHETERERVLTFFNDVSVEEVTDEMQKRVAQQETEELRQSTLRAAAKGDEEEVAASLAAMNVKDDGSFEEIGGTLRAGHQPLMDQDGKEEWEMMERFWGKYNKVVLDVSAIQQEKQHLQNENTKLRALLKQYMDGISVTPEVMGAKNNLLMTSKMHSTVRPDANTLAATRGRGPGVIPVREANEVVVNVARQRAALPIR